MTFTSAGATGPAKVRRTTWGRPIASHGIPFGPLWDADATDAQKADAIAALREILALGTAFTAELEALNVPPNMLAEHSANVANFRDIHILIRESLALHDAGKTTDALAVDLATNGIAAQINDFESRLGLTPCP